MAFLPLTSAQSPSCFCRRFVKISSTVSSTCCCSNLTIVVVRLHSCSKCLDHVRTIDHPSQLRARSQISKLAVEASCSSLWFTARHSKHRMRLGCCSLGRLRQMLPGSLELELGFHIPELRVTDNLHHHTLRGFKDTEQLGVRCSMSLAGSLWVCPNPHAFYFDT
jgi:hypothetical protein